jgi:ApbE superfamily uncharacterized protein (UPF0280 family)
VYTHRTYRRFDQDQRLVAFQAAVGETDLYIKARQRLVGEALRLIREARTEIESYIGKHPEFRNSLAPLPLNDSAPALVKEMMEAGTKAQVGPMAGVAGAIAEYVGRGLRMHSSEIIVENGGDLFLTAEQPVTVDIFAGPSPLSRRIGFKLYPSHMPLGVCTSSGSVGPSFSFGNADAVTVISPYTTLADAMATAIANKINSEDSIFPVLETTKDAPGITAVLIIVGDKLGVWGDLEMVRLSPR